jgi:hypothetical protein
MQPPHCKCDGNQLSMGRTGSGAARAVCVMLGSGTTRAKGDLNGPESAASGEFRDPRALSSLPPLAAS